MKDHYYSLTGSWVGGGRAGQGKFEVGNLSSVISVPKDLDGPGVGTDPESLLLASASSCYLITLAMILERRKLSAKKIELTSEGVLEQNGAKLRFKLIVHRPRVEFEGPLTADGREQILQLLTRAEGACLISNAMRGNVEIRVEGTVIGG